MIPASTNQLLAAGFGYQISRSVRLRSSASAYFNRTPASAGNRQTWTWSGWVKRGTLGSWQIFFGAWDGVGGNDTTRLDLAFEAANTLSITGGVTVFRQSTQVFRDPSAWYHIVIVANTTSATAQNRLRVYVNNVEITTWSTNNTVTQNTTLAVNNNASHVIGARGSSPTQYFDGYLTELNFIDGQALDPSAFGETNVTTGVWQPKRYTGTYGTNGFFLNFSDPSAATAAAIGKDYSGNGNNWTPNNISVTAGATYDSMLDVPTQWADGGNGRGNYAVLSPIVPTGAAVISGGNLNIISTATYCNGLSTINLDSGAYYCECVVTTHSAEGWGVWDITKTAAINTGAGTSSGFYGIYSGGATLVTAGIGGTTNAAGTPANGDIIQVAWSNGNVWVGKNNVWYNSTFGTTGNPSAGTNPTFTGLTVGQFAFIFGAGNATVSLSANFGQRPFSYTPPSGFKALNTLNLPTPTILKGNQYMDVVLYTGNAVQDRAVTGFGFDLDLAWIKSRNNVGSHVLVNREVGGDKQLFSNLTNAEQTNSDVTNGFTTGGILVGDNLTGTGSTNQNTYTYALWGWKEGATQGFDIVTYTGTGSATTVAHSLGVAPAMIIAKGRGGTSTSWWVYHKSLGTPVLEMNSTAASATYVSVFNNTAPTSSVFSVGTGDTNRSGQTQLAYLFAEVAGFSKFGSYTGNGSADGPFVFCGFRPRWIMFKNTTGFNWQILDTARATSNQGTLTLFPNLSDAENTTATQYDILSNGFKIRTSDAGSNGNGNTIIFAAFSEHPFKNALAR